MRVDNEMTNDEYKRRIAALLMRDGIVRAGVAPNLAAHCVSVVAEQSVSDRETLSAITRLEQMAGITVDDDGNYIGEDECP